MVTQLILHARNDFVRCEWLAAIKAKLHAFFVEQSFFRLQVRIDIQLRYQRDGIFRTRGLA